jgi:hypothetical protein
MKRIYLLIIIGALLAGTVVSCSYDPYVRRGRAGGAALGAATGAVIGNNVKGGNSWGGAAIGAAVGGFAGDRRGKMNSMYYGNRYNRGYYGSSGYYGGRSRYYRYY